MGNSKKSKSDTFGMFGMKKGGADISFRPAEIITARYTLESAQQDIYDNFLSKIGDENDSLENTTYEILVAEMKNMYTVADPSNCYKRLKNAVEGFKTKGFTVKNARGNREYYAWFTRIEYDDTNESKIILDIHPNVKKMLLMAKHGAYYDKKIAMNISGKYTRRLYYFLQDNIYRKSFNIKIDEFREMFELGESYSNSKIKTRILDVAKEELSANTDIIFDYKMCNSYGLNKNFDTILFDISSKSQKQVVEIENYVEVEIEDLSEKILDIIGEGLQCSKEDAQKLLDFSIKTGLVKNNDYSKLLEEINYTRSKNTKNPYKYCMAVIEKICMKSSLKENKRKINDMEFTEFEQQIISN